MEKAELFRGVPLFSGLDNADLRRLGDVATEEVFPMGKQIFAEGTQRDSFFIIKFGTVRVLKQGKEGEEEVARTGVGQHFGEMALIDNDRRSATVEALEHTELLRIRREDLEKLTAKDASLGHRVYKVFARYLCHRLRQTTAELTFMREVAKRRGS